ncbi:MAG TPA: hypothetical protein VIM79_24610 [Niastella sp.]
MAEVFAPFIVNRTIRNLTFYVMEGRNFVRKKSSLTRRKVLYSPRFAPTRHYASLMGDASRIGSWVYNSLPDFWRQSWMYRSFTGEAFTMLKKGMEECAIKEFLWSRYVQEVVQKQVAEKPFIPELVVSKRPYKKQNINYWQSKKNKSFRRKELIQQRRQNAGLLAEASKIASALYSGIPVRDRNRSIYQQLTGEAMRWLKEQGREEVIIKAQKVASLPPEKCVANKWKKKVRSIGSIYYGTGMFYFIAQQKQRYLVRIDDMANRIIYTPVKNEISPYP